MSGSPEAPFPTITVTGVVASPWAIWKVLVAPSPVNDSNPPLTLSCRSFNASITRFHSSGVRICGKGRR